MSNTGSNQESDLNNAVDNISEMSIDNNDEDDESDICEMPSMEDIEKFRPKTRSGMLISGWDDQDENVEIETNPHESPEKEILWAAENGQLDIVQKLLNMNPELINSRDKDKYTPLHRAAYNNHNDIALKLLLAGADPNAKTEYKWTPLHSACKWNNASIAALLIQYGADINAQSDGGQTPLHIASSSSHCKEILTLLLMSEGIKPNLKNSSNETAADIAKRSGKYHYLFEMAHSAINLEE